MRRVDCSHTLDEPGPASSPESLHELEPGFRFYDSITELVHQSVMPPADKNEIVELRFTPVRPVDDVVTVDVAALGTTGILAGPIAGSQRPSYGRWNDPRLAAHVQYLTLTIFQHRHQCPVTGELSVVSGCRCGPPSTVGNPLVPEDVSAEMPAQNVSAETCTTT